MYHLENSVNELNALVEDLNQLLQLQDANIESTNEYAEATEQQIGEGTSELAEAERYSRKIQWAKVVSFLVAIFLICGIVGLILAVSLSTGPRNR